MIFPRYCYPIPARSHAYGKRGYLPIAVYVLFGWVLFRRLFPASPSSALGAAAAASNLPMGLTCSKKAFADTAELVRTTSTRNKSQAPRSTTPQNIERPRFVLFSPKSSRHVSGGSGCPSHVQRFCRWKPAQTIYIRERSFRSTMLDPGSWRAQLSLHHLSRVPTTAQGVPLAIGQGKL